MDAIILTKIPAFIVRLLNQIVESIAYEKSLIWYEVCEQIPFTLFEDTFIRVTSGGYFFDDGEIKEKYFHFYEVIFLHRGLIANYPFSDFISLLRIKREEVESELFEGIKRSLINEVYRKKKIKNTQTKKGDKTHV